MSADGPGVLAPAAFEWRYLTPSESAIWRHDVQTVRVDEAGAGRTSVLADALATLREDGVTRVVVRGSEWTGDSGGSAADLAAALASLPADADLTVIDLDADSPWRRSGAATAPPAAAFAGRLDVVVINTTTHEADAVAELLRVWSLPAHAPRAGGDAPFRLVVLLNQEPGDEYRDAVRAACTRGALAGAVTEVEFVVLALPAEHDRYERHRRGDPGPYGFKSGPNLQFFRGLDALEARFAGAGFALVIEADTRPVRAGWVSAARAEVARHSDAWVLGSVYRGPETAVRGEIRVHLNGNAIYSLGHEFGDFRRSCWEPALLRLVEANPNAAYDYALATVMTAAVATQWDAQLRAEWHRLRAVDYLQNLVVWQRFDPNAVDWATVVTSLRRDHPGTYLVHGVRGSGVAPWA